YDPYQIFEVQHTPCLILTVRVLRGRNITLGFQDYYDTPDPYINLILRSSPEGKKSTTVKQNDTNPVWDETFTFYINFTQSNVLEINLMESNAVWFDQKVGTVYYDIVNIREMDKPLVETFVFNKISQVDIEFQLEFDRNPTLRYSLCLSTQEKEFMELRKEKTLEGMRKLLGVEDGPLNIDEVPTVAVIGSGGGFRAMTGYSGVFKALSESGVLDCTMYACGLSGSSWLLSTLYSHPKWPNLDMNEFLDELKHSVDKSLLRFLNASTMYSYMKFMIQKRKEGQPVSFTDIFGRMVGETLLKGRMETTLTDQREKIKDGTIPMPLYTCVHVKKDVPARSFQEWVEFSPYEIGLPKYGTFMDSELFGSKFFMGKLVKQYKEQPLHFLQGIWGSAFCILFKRLLEDNRRIDPVEMVRQEMGKQLDEAGQESSSDCSDDEVNSWELLSTRRGRAAVIHNFMRGLSLQQTYPLSPFTPVENRVKAGDEFDGNFEMHSTSVKHIYMVDAGLTFNSPFPLVLRPQREVDIILSFDFSARDSDNAPPFKELLLAEKWARLNRLPFPPIDTAVFDREGMKELYIFRHPTDPHCPVVFHFVLVNKTFRYYKKPGIPRETKEEFNFADFDIFDDPKAPYSTFNFTYAHKNFEQLSQLMEFNTLLHIDDIREVRFSSFDTF
ncbi:unnamed protein product, partial [Candidula unifasciata]